MGCEAFGIRTLSFPYDTGSFDTGSFVFHVIRFTRHARDYDGTHAAACLPLPLFLCQSSVAIRGPSFSRLSLDPFRTAVSFWVQTTQISSRLPPKRDCGPKSTLTPPHTPASHRYLLYPVSSCITVHVWQAWILFALQLFATYWCCKSRDVLLEVSWVAEHDYTQRETAVRPRGWPDRPP